MKRDIKVYFHLGLNTRVPPKKLKDGECSIAQDVCFDEIGHIQSRKFKNRHLDLGNTVRSIYPYSNLFINVNGKLYNGTRLIGSGYSSAPFQCAEYNGVLYGVSGSDRIRYDGSDLYNIGNDKPSYKPVISEGAAGTLIGSYYYKYRYEDKFGLESNSSVVSDVITVSSKKIIVSLMPSTSERVVYINLYRIGGNLTDYYFVDNILNSAASLVIVYKAADAAVIGNTILNINDYLYATSGTLGFYVNTISDAGAFTTVDSDVQAGGKSYGAMCVSDLGYIYITTNDNTIYIYSFNETTGVISYIGADTSIDLGASGGSVQSVCCSGNLLFIGIAYDHPILPASKVCSKLLVYKINANGSITYVTSQLLKGYPLGDLLARTIVVISGNFLYVLSTAGSTAVYVFSFDAGGNLTLKATNNINALAIFVDSSFFYTVQGGIIKTYTVDSNGVLSLKGTLDLGVGYTNSIYAKDNYVYVSDENTGLYVASVDGNGVLTLIDDYDGGSTYYSCYADDRFIYTGGGTGKLQSHNMVYAYTDDIIDSSLSLLINNEDKDKPSPGIKFITEHYERIIGARSTDYPNDVVYSTEYYPEYWGLNLSNHYLLGSNDECTGLLSWGRYVVFWKKHQIYIMEGEDPIQWHRRRSDSAKGNVAPHALMFWQLPLFVSYDGWYSFDGNRETKFSDRVDSVFKKYKYDLPNACGIIHNNKAYLSFGDVTLIYDLVNQVYYTYNFRLNALCYDHRIDVLYGGVDNQVVKLEEDLNDGDDTVDFKIRSKAVALNDVEGKPGSVEDLYFVADTNNESVALNIYIDNLLKKTISFIASGGLYYRIGLIGKYAEFEFVYSGTKQIKIEPPLLVNPWKESDK